MLVKLLLRGNFCFINKLAKIKMKNKIYVKVMFYINWRNRDILKVVLGKTKKSYLYRTFIFCHRNFYFTTIIQKNYKYILTIE